MPNHAQPKLDESEYLQMAKMIMPKLANAILIMLKLIKTKSHSEKFADAKNRNAKYCKV